MDTNTTLAVPGPEFWTSVDPLREVLHLMRMGGVFYALSELGEPWGMDLPAIPDTMMFHFVTEGRCWLEVGDEEAEVLEPGTLALVPHGRGHRLVSKPGGAAVDLFSIPRTELSDRYELIRYGGEGPLTRLVCGAVHFENPAARQLVELLPPVICTRADGAPEVEWLHSTLRFMASEARDLKPGGETVITRLADVLVIQTLRTWLAGDTGYSRKDRPGWLRALHDPRAGRAIALVHRNPEAPWSVATLAAKVGMSRSAFAAHFKSLAGETPMQYVTRWRMLLATSLLHEEDVQLAELAARVGYQSEAAFSRAFKRSTGMSPGRVRRAGPKSRSGNGAPGTGGL